MPAARMIKKENENKNCFHSGLVSTISSSMISVPSNQRKRWYIDYENCEKRLAIVDEQYEPEVSIRYDCGQYALSVN
jgi:Uri superfamily endonuclease